MPELLWKAYIDFEIAQGERERARALYERLLERTKHVKVWMSFAKFEATPLEALAAEQAGGEEDAAAARCGYLCESVCVYLCKSVCVCCSQDMYVQSAGYVEYLRTPIHIPTCIHVAPTPKKQQQPQHQHPNH